MMRSRVSLWVLVCLAGLSHAQTAVNFPALEQWKAAIIKGDVNGLRALYSTSPPAQISTRSGKLDADTDVAFWTGLKARRISMAVVESASPRPGVQSFTIQMTVTGASGRVTKFVEGQAWLNQQEAWRLVSAKRDLARLEQPASVDNKIYPTGDAREEIQQALARAKKGHKNVLLVFGADWCYDCHVLDKAFHRGDISAVLTPSYEVVHVDIGEEDKNLDLAAHYQVPLNRGIPAIAVLDSQGNLLYSQRNGEWERARALGPDDLLELLNRWKPQAR
jgi:hypothetical protein